ncbi:uncharacterized protein TRAVEDRAFT_50357 [Trametes versicolor FP-101664 SS1]|uniref:uncharacterized protein n=1 Tax=Trametes versicolor (strain FP-101664) TaxID=717944 RepID=UPI00046235F3|nr:uncharacterized protein TRAVEDRAFT_50357 [Trametes versicolor FP-101664 SS1]EIW55871.1 hypothetical protein TRAVEDRAFT_50357 [Trametes versicolor FP-101664 SS1]
MSRRSSVAGARTDGSLHAPAVFQSGLSGRVHCLRGDVSGPGEDVLESPAGHTASKHPGTLSDEPGLRQTSL